LTVCVGNDNDDKDDDSADNVVQALTNFAQQLTADVAHVERILQTAFELTESTTQFGGLRVGLTERRLEGDWKETERRLEGTQGCS